MQNLTSDLVEWTFAVAMTNRDDPCLQRCVSFMWIWLGFYKYYLAWDYVFPFAYVSGIHFPALTSLLCKRVSIENRNTAYSIATSGTAVGYSDCYFLSSRTSDLEPCVTAHLEKLLMKNENLNSMFLGLFFCFLFHSATWKKAVFTQMFKR